MEKYSYCPKCAGTLERKSVPWEPEKKELICRSCSFVFWQNAKPTASAIIQNDREEVLLVLRAVDPFRGMWDTPGGFLEEDEHPENGVRREVLEELNMEVEPYEILVLAMDQYGDDDITLNIFYLCEVVKGEPEPSSEVAEAHWFPADDLPERMAFRNNEEALNAWLISLGKAPAYDLKTRL